MKPRRPLRKLLALGAVVAGMLLFDPSIERAEAHRRWSSCRGYGGGFYGHRVGFRNYGWRGYHRPGGYYYAAPSYYYAPAPGYYSTYYGYGPGYGYGYGPGFSRSGFGFFIGY